MGYVVVKDGRNIPILWVMEDSEDDNDGDHDDSDKKWSPVTCR